MPEFSVIVPVYKVEKYLDRCIGSILAQTFSDFELILIDDGSPDNSGQICDEYAGKDNRIHVIHKENGGVSTARNAGLDIAQGKFIVFVDSDDEVDKNYLECMRGYNADMVIAGVKNYSIDGSLHHTVSLPQRKIEKLSKDSICQIIDYNALNYPISKRYLRTIIQEHRLRFREGMNLCEDTLFFSEYLCHCSSVQYLSDTPYNYFKYKTTTLTSFKPDYILRQTTADNLIGKTLDEAFPGVILSSSWKKRNWNILYYCVFYVLREWDAPATEKKRTLKIIFAMPAFKEYRQSLDYYMENDSVFLRRLLGTGNAVVVMLGWKMIQLISKLKGKTRECVKKTV